MGIENSPHFPNPEPGPQTDLGVYPSVGDFMYVEQEIIDRIGQHIHQPEERKRLNEELINLKMKFPDLWERAKHYRQSTVQKDI